MDIVYEFQILDFKARMLGAEIEMQGMIAENKYRESIGESNAYGEEHFDGLIAKYTIGVNDVPEYRG